MYLFSTTKGSVKHLVKSAVTEPGHHAERSNRVTRCVTIRHRHHSPPQLKIESNINISCPFQNKCQQTVVSVVTKQLCGYLKSVQLKTVRNRYCEFASFARHRAAASGGLVAASSEVGGYPVRVRLIARKDASATHANGLRRGRRLRQVFENFLLLRASR